MIFNALTVTTIGLSCKAFLNSGLCSLNVSGLQVILDVLRSTRERGVLTVSNHISTLDDPLTWGVLPSECYFNPRRRMRWALGASEILFTNPILSAFFRQGQVLETFRGKGIHQPAVDIAIQKLNEHGWVHLFPEGKINQPHNFLIDENGAVSLPRFKWGVGRILMETNVPPIIIPMWITGFDKLMPEGRSFPYNYVPKLFTNISITFGDPIPPNIILEAVRKRDCSSLETSNHNDSANPEPGKRAHTAFVRSELTAIIQRAVEDLGRKVSGKDLGKQS